MGWAALRGLVSGAVEVYFRIERWKGEGRGGYRDSRCSGCMEERMDGVESSLWEGIQVEGLWD